MQQGGHTPVMVLNTGTKRETGRKAQLANITATKAIADIVTSTLGPKSMLKMLLDPMGGIVLSNDGHAILREIDVNHPAAKSMLEISRAQDEEVGDGTTSVIILAGEMMVSARQFIERDIHPTIIVGAYHKALQYGLQIMQDLAVPIDPSQDSEVKKALNCCISTKFASRWGDLMIDLALKACRIIMRSTPPSKLTADLKRYAKVEKVPGGLIEDCTVLNGVMVNKDHVHPKMRRQIKNPRIMLLDCTLEYKKGESQTNLEMMKDTDMSDALEQEMNEIAQMCSFILKWKPDVLITEKGISDLAQHYLLKGNITAIRRIRKTDQNRVARVSGAKIVNRPEEFQESDMGLNCGLFDIRKVGDDYFTFFEECKDATACTIMMRGASKDVLNEMERNFQDALAVARNIFTNPKLIPGGGAIEMELSHKINEKAKTVEGLEQMPLRALANSLEVIPRTLAQNCGSDVVRVITELRAKHASDVKEGKFFGIDGQTGKMNDMRVANIWEPLAVKEQVIKSACESSCMLLRIDDVVSGFKKKKPQKAGVMEQPQGGAPEEMIERE